MDEKNIDRFDEIVELINNLIATFSEFNQSINDIISNNLNNAYSEVRNNAQYIREQYQRLLNQLNELAGIGNIALPDIEITGNLRENIPEIFRNINQIERNLIDNFVKNFNQRWSGFQNIINTLANELNRIVPQDIFSREDIINTIKQNFENTIRNNPNILWSKNTLAEFVRNFFDDVNSSFAKTLNPQDFAKLSSSLSLLGEKLSGEIQIGGGIEEIGRGISHMKSQIINYTNNLLKNVINDAQNYVNNFIERRTTSVLHGVDIPGIEPSLEYMSIGKGGVYDLIGDNAKRINAMIEHAQKILGEDFSIIPSELVSDTRNITRNKLKFEMEKGFEKLMSNIDKEIGDEYTRELLKGKMRNIYETLYDTTNFSDITKGDVGGVSSIASMEISKIERIMHERGIDENVRRRVITDIGDFTDRSIRGLQSLSDIDRIMAGNLTFAERFRDFIAPLGHIANLTGQMYMFTGIFGLTSPLFYQLSILPTQVAEISYYPFLQSALGLTGLQNFMNVFQQFPQMVPQLMMNLQEEITSISAMFGGSRTIGARAVETALKIAKTEPIQFQEALAVIRTGAIYPELRQYIMQPEFQRKIFNVAQMLATIQPEQGIEGALFAIRELFGGQTRSLQTRFNLDIDLIAQQADISVAKLKSSPPHKIIEYLEKALTNMMGGTEFLTERAFTFRIQLGNLIDTLTQGIILPLNKEAQSAKTFIANYFGFMGDEQGKMIVSPEFRKVGRQLFPYLYERFEETYGEDADKKLAEFLSRVGSSPIGLLTLATNVINSTLDKIFEDLNLGEILSRILAKNIGKVFDLSKALQSGEITSKEYLAGLGNIGKNIVRELVSGLEESGLMQIISGISSSISKIIFEPLMREITKGAIMGFIEAPLTIANILSSSIANVGRSIFGFFTGGGFGAGDIREDISNILEITGGLVSNALLLSGSIRGNLRLAVGGFGAGALFGGLSGIVKDKIDIEDAISLGLGLGSIGFAKTQSLRFATRLGLGSTVGLGGGLIGTHILGENSLLSNILSFGISGAIGGALMGGAFGGVGSIIGGIAGTIGGIGFGVYQYFNNRRKLEEINKMATSDLALQTDQAIAEFEQFKKQEYNEIYRLLPPHLRSGFEKRKDEYINKLKEWRLQEEQTIESSIKDINELIDEGKKPSFMRDEAPYLRHRITGETTDEDIGRISKRISEKYEIPEPIVRQKLTEMRDERKYYEDKMREEESSLLTPKEMEETALYHLYKAQGMPIKPLPPSPVGKSPGEYLKELINYKYEEEQYFSDLTKFNSRILNLAGGLAKVDDKYGLPSHIKDKLKTFTSKMASHPNLPEMIERAGAGFALNLLALAEQYGSESDVGRIIDSMGKAFDNMMKKFDYQQKYEEMMLQAFEQNIKQQIMGNIEQPKMGEPKSQPRISQQPHAEDKSESFISRIGKQIGLGLTGGIGLGLTLLTETDLGSNLLGLIEKYDGNIGKAFSDLIKNFQRSKQPETLLLSEPVKKDIQTPTYPDIEQPQSSISEPQIFIRPNIPQHSSVLIPQLSIYPEFLIDRPLNQMIKNIQMPTQQPISPLQPQILIPQAQPQMSIHPNAPQILIPQPQMSQIPQQLSNVNNVAQNVQPNMLTSANNINAGTVNITAGSVNITGSGTVNIN